MLYFGDTGVAWALRQLEALVDANIDHPARELMWGSPGTLLAALFMHRRCGELRWQQLFARTAQRLHEQLRFSDEHRCHYWTQDLYGRTSTYLDAVLICLAGFPDDSLDDLLLAAGELTWQAGPLAKGCNLCYGTGGNGYAFLKLWRRFGEERWLQRARAFAMHAIAQCDTARRDSGQWRHGLWTGDLGLALYLLDCIEGKDRFPTLDHFD